MCFQWCEPEINCVSTDVSHEIGCVSSGVSHEIGCVSSGVSHEIGCVLLLCLGADSVHCGEHQCCLEQASLA